MRSMSTIRSPRAPIAAALVLVLPGCVLVNGCAGASRLLGGGAAATRGATATVRISWPARPDSRLIPLASNSIRIAIAGPDGFSATQVIARPATMATFANLPPGALTVVASAHPRCCGGWRGRCGNRSYP